MSKLDKYRYLGTGITSSDALRVTYAVHKPPSCPAAAAFAPLFKPNLTFPIVGCTCYALHQPPALLNQLLTNQKSHGTLSFGRPDARFRKPAIGRPINEFRGTGCAGRRGFPWEGPKQPSSPRPSPALTPVAAQRPKESPHLAQESPNPRAQQSSSPNP